MATTSTVYTVKAQLVTQIASAIADAGETTPVTYAWPGKDTTREAIFLGPHPATADIRIDNTGEQTSIKSGRQRRNESYTVRVTVWTFRPDLDPNEAATCEQRAFTLAAVVEGLIAATPRFGLAASVVQGSYISSSVSTLFPFKTGWACELGLDVNVDAYLT